MSEQRLRIAIQKKGRLSDDTVKLLKACGVKINLNTQRLIAHSENMPIDILRVRDDDIPGLVMDGVVDLGFIGQNVLEEECMQRNVANEATAHQVVKELAFGECRFHSPLIMILTIKMFTPLRICVLQRLMFIS